jgi:hypothetical protein
MIKSQEKTTKFHGLGVVIAAKTGFSKDYCNRVLGGKIPTGGQKARRILEIANKLNEALEQV